ncbi:MAG: reverse transcriptase domain-containing protein [Firmicutes bacterium]|nr:reverse transcriptase domain-containing protein [Bacillota bacterium]
MNNKNEINSLLDLLSCEKQWQLFFEHKKQKHFLTDAETKELGSFIDSKAYLKISQNLENYFKYPKRKEVNKTGTNKKRIVYMYTKEEGFVLKLLAWLLNKYDYHFHNNLFSFRKEYGVRLAIKNLLKQIGNKKMYCYKLDIKNYFNSIDIKLLLPKLKDLCCDDASLYDFFDRMLNFDTVNKHGVMAGTPTSPFLSNLFLTELDKHFLYGNIPYARYSDDIIIFAKSEEELLSHRKYVADYLTSQNLVINTNKEQIILPNKPWEFLGISHFDGTIDLSSITIEKIKAKIRRKARAIYRWKRQKNAPSEKALKVMIREFNKKFFMHAGSGELTWSRWFFPLINTDKGLKAVDEYLQTWLRWLYTGKHNKANFDKIGYKDLKDLGYECLVNRYWKGEHKFN